MFYGHAMLIGNSQNIFSGLSLSRRSNNKKLTRFKIAADILIAFAGEFFFIEEINRRHRLAIMFFKLKSVLYLPDATTKNRTEILSSTF